ncbi:MAG: hypothetical protein COW42_13090, partial [Deltaproteobacteria bacterium CG17_big_fil_post_rev_8_21_14_2_50_63_7]
MGIEGDEVWPDPLRARVEAADALLSTSAPPDPNDPADPFFRENNRRADANRAVAFLREVREIPSDVLSSFGVPAEAVVTRYEYSEVPYSWEFQDLFALHFWDPPTPEPGTPEACTSLQGPQVVMLYSRDLLSLLGRITRVDRRLTPAELVEGAPEIDSSAILSDSQMPTGASGDYWVVELENRYDWHPESYSFGRVLAQRWGNDVEVSATETTHPMNPSPDGDALTDDWSTALPQFDFEYVDANLFSELPKLEAMAAMTDSDGVAFGVFPEHDGETVPGLEVVGTTCERNARAYPPFKTHKILVYGQYAPVDEPTWEATRQALLDAKENRVRYGLKRVCEVVKTTDRSGVVTYNGLNFMGLSVIELKQGRVSGDLEDSLVTLTRYNADGLPREVVSQPQHRGPRTLFEYDEQNPNPLETLNLLKVTELPGALHGESTLPAGGASPRTTLYSYEPLANGLLSMTDPAGAQTRWIYEFQESAEAKESSKNMLEFFGLDGSAIDRVPIAGTTGDLNGDGSTSYNRPLAIAVIEPTFESTAGPTSVTTTLRYNGFGQPAAIERAGHTVSQTYMPTGMLFVGPDSLIPTYVAPPQAVLIEGGPLLTTTETTDFSASSTEFQRPDPLVYHTTAYRYGGPDGRLSEVLHDGNFGGNSTIFSYDGFYQVDQTTTPDGLALSDSYDGVGRLTRRRTLGVGTSSGGLQELSDQRILRSTGGATLATCESTDSDACEGTLEELLATRAQGNPSSLVTTHALDGESRVVETVSPELRATALSYHPWGPVLSTTQYDPVGTDPSQRLSSVSLDVFGAPYQSHLWSTATSEKLTSLKLYDGFGRVVSSRDPEGVIHRWLYDVAHRVVREEKWQQYVGQVAWTDYQRDPTGRVQQVTQSYVDSLSSQAPSITQLAHTLQYDPNGRVSCIASPQGLEEVRQYASDGTLAVRRTANTEPGLACTGANAEPLATQSHWSSLAARRALSKTVHGSGPDAFGSSTEAQLDWTGRVTWTATTKGLLPNSDVATSSHRYDELGRLRWSDDEWATRTTYKYDEASRLTGRSENRVAGATSMGDLEITYSYDRDGLPTRLIDPDDHETTSTYDILGRKRTQTTVGPQGDPKTDVFTYDPLDRLILRANGEGFWQYAPLPGRRRISTAAYRNMGGGLLGPLTTELRFTYDSLGHVTEATRTERNQEV